MLLSNARATALQNGRSINPISAMSGSPFDELNRKIGGYVQQNIIAANTDTAKMFPGTKKPSDTELPWYKNLWNKYTGFIQWEYETVKSAGSSAWQTVTAPIGAVRDTVNNTVGKITDTLQIGLYAAIAVGGVIIIGYARQALK